MSQIQKNISMFALAIMFTFIAVYLMFSATWMGAVGGLVAATALSGFTLIIGLMVLAIQYQRNKAAFADKQKSGDNMAVQQTRSIEIDLPFDLAFEIALEALASLNGEDIPKTLSGIPSKQVLKIKKSNREIGRIEAGLRARTLGITDFMDFSHIDIQLQRLDSTTTRLEIDSRPSNPMEGFDLGRHTHYVNHLALTIRKASREHTAAEHLSDSREDAHHVDEINPGSQEFSDHE